MCGIAGYWNKDGEGAATGQVMLSMLCALACRGPDSAGVAVIGPQAEVGQAGIWSVRLAGSSRGVLTRLKLLGEVVATDTAATHDPRDNTLRFHFRPAPGTTPADVEKALSVRRGSLEVLGLGTRLDLVKQVGAPEDLEAIHEISRWHGPLAIGHTRMSTESRIDLSHSQPFWAHGVLDLATVHNGHVTNYHQLRRRYEQQGITFYTDNDSEVIGVYLQDRLMAGRTLQEALADSIDDLDGAFNYLVVSTEGLGVVRDRFGFKPLVLAETDEFVAVATEEIALRQAIPGDYVACEPPAGAVVFFPLPALQLSLA